MYTLEQGEMLVRAARRAIEGAVSGGGGRIVANDGELHGFEERRGVFVTLEEYPSHGLRGCIGYPEPVGPLRKLLPMAAAAAVEDPRFGPLTQGELGGVTVCVSVLSELEAMDCKGDWGADEIVIGRDGLVIRYGRYGGLLLPVVAVEQGWDQAQFLDGVCAKASLPEGTWRRPGAVVYKFSTQVFAEASPNGEIREGK